MSTPLASTSTVAESARRPRIDSLSRFEDLDTIQRIVSRSKRSSRTVSETVLRDRFVTSEAPRIPSGIRSKIRRNSAQNRVPDPISSEIGGPPPRGGVDPPPGGVRTPVYADVLGRFKTAEKRPILAEFWSFLARTLAPDALT